jgi:hypothetical protein
MDDAASAGDRAAVAGRADSDTEVLEKSSASGERQASPAPAEPAQPAAAGEADPPDRPGLRAAAGEADPPDRPGLRAAAGEADPPGWPGLRAVHGLDDEVAHRGDRDAPAGGPFPFFYPRGEAEPAADRPDAGTPADGGGRSSARYAVAVGVVLALLVVAGSAIILAGLALGVGPAAPGPDAGTAPGVNTNAGAGTAALSAPVNGRRQASLDMVSGTSTMTLRAADLGDELYRIASPAHSSVTPHVDEHAGTVYLSLRATGNDGPGAVEVLLNASVRWNLRLGGGVRQSVLDMAGGTLERLDLAGGATRIELTLPRPDGTLAVRMTGGIHEFLVHTPAQIPTRVRVGRGAGRVVLDGRTHNGVAGGELFTPPGWAASVDRIDLDAVAGMGTLTVNAG